MQRKINVLVSMTSFTSGAFGSDFVHDLLDFLHRHWLAGDGTEISGHAKEIPVVTVLCHADFNHDGSVNVTDIFDFLASWFANQHAADFNNDGANTVQDIFDFLAAWFGPC